MASPLAERFMQALQSAEATNTVDPLLDLFTDEPELRRMTGEAPVTGRDAARRFWQEYLSSFRRIRSQFTNVVEAGSTIMLEWVSEAEPQTGPAFQYQGISILETAQDHVQRFRTYYDSARFVPVVDGER